MKRRGRNAVDLLEYPRREAKRVANQDRPTRLVRLGDARVVPPHHRRQRPKHQGQAVAAMPEIRMLRHSIEGFLRLRRDELQPRARADAAKRLRREQRDIVASLPQRAPDSNEWVYVAARADWREEKMRHSGRRYRLRRRRVERYPPPPGFVVNESGCLVRTWLNGGSG